MKVGIVVRVYGSIGLEEKTWWFERIVEMPEAVLTTEATLAIGLPSDEWKPDMRDSHTISHRHWSEENGYRLEFLYPGEEADLKKKLSLVRSDERWKEISDPRLNKKE
jgi:hypothetical protein